MCTALSWSGNKHFFGRNLDLDYSYHEQVTICPRYFPFTLRHGYKMDEHYAFIGMATTVGGYPLFYDATNEKGLSIAGLNFPQNAVYHGTIDDKFNLTSFELVPWIMGTCQTVAEVKEKIEQWNITNEPFSDEYPPSPLHWLLADSEASIVIESMADGLHVYDNPVNILTNNPPFPQQLFNLNNYRYLGTREANNTGFPKLDLDVYSLGMGGLGLPGDLSSSSRFVRGAFTMAHATPEDDYKAEVHQFFHLLESVKQVKGLCFVPHSKKHEYTLYTSCVDTKSGIYYYKTYFNSHINAIDLHRTNLDTAELSHYDLIFEEDFNFSN